MDYTDHTNTFVIAKIPVPAVSAVVRFNPSTLTDFVRYSGTESNEGPATPALSQSIPPKRSRDRSRKSPTSKSTSSTALLYTSIISILRPKRSAAEAAIKKIIGTE